MMKKAIVYLAAVIISIPAIGISAAVAEMLPPDTPSEVRASFRAMVRAGAPAGDAAAMTQSMLRNRFTNRQVVQAHLEVQTAAAEQLDPEQVMQKAREGLAKGAPAEDIIKAMNTVRERHRFSHQLAGELTNDRRARVRLRQMITDAQKAGVDGEDCEQVAARVRTRQREMKRKQAAELAEESMAALRDMARLGASSQASADCVGAALEAKYGAGEMEAMRFRFRAQLEAGTADALARSFAFKIANGAGPGQLGYGGGSGGGGGTGGQGKGPGSGGGGGGGKGHGGGGAGHP